MHMILRVPNWVYPLDVTDPSQTRVLRRVANKCVYDAVSVKLFRKIDDSTHNDGSVRKTLVDHNTAEIKV